MGVKMNQDTKFQHLRIENVGGDTKEAKYELKRYCKPDGSEYEPTGEFRVPVVGEYWTTPKETRIYGPYEEGTTSLYSTVEHGLNRVILTQVKAESDPFFDGASRIADTRLLRMDYFILRCRACGCGDEGYVEEPIIYQREGKTSVIACHPKNNSAIARIMLSHERVEWLVPREDVAYVDGTVIQGQDHDDIPF